MRTVSVKPHRRYQTYSKYPNQWLLVVLWKQPRGLFGQPSTCFSSPLLPTLTVPPLYRHVFVSVSDIVDWCYATCEFEKNTHDQPFLTPACVWLSPGFMGLVLVGSPLPGSTGTAGKSCLALLK